MKTSRCTLCKQVKPLDRFYKYRLYNCMECYREVVRQSRKKSNSKESVKAMHKARYHKHRAKYLARSRVGKAVASGKLIKPDSCSDCGMPRKLQAHHEDYGKPLDVVWLCQICHNSLHGRLVDLNLISA